MALAWPAKVIHVTTADSLTVMDMYAVSITLALHGVAAPAPGQNHAEEAAAYARDRAFGQPVSVRELGVDSKGRIDSLVTLMDGLSLNADLVANGWAWIDRDDCRVEECGGWIQLEDKARRERLGLWQDKHPVPPWEWRARKKQE